MNPWGRDHHLRGGTRRNWVTAHQKHPTGDEPRRTPEMINEGLEVMTDLAKEGAR